MSNLRNHERKDAVKWVIVAIVLVAIIAAIVLGVLSSWYTNWDTSTWFGNGNEETVEEEDPPVEDEIDEADSEVSGAVMGESTGTGMLLASASIARANYEEYGVSPMAETAYALTATITPATADNKNVDWSVAWANSSSSWANGKTVTDYVTVAPTSSGSLTATVACKQAFGEQVIVTCTSQQNADIKATCTVDYEEKISSVMLTLDISGESYVINDSPLLPVPDSGTMSVDVEKTVGTVMQDFSSSVSLTFTDSFYSALIDEFGGSIFPMEPSVKTLSQGSFSFSEGFFDEMLFSNPSSSVPPILIDQITAQVIEFINNYSGDVLEFTVTVTGGDSPVTYVYECPLGDIVVPVGGVSLDEDGIIF